MRADLQNLLNTPVLSSGQILRNKNMVLAYLMMRQFAPNISLNMVNVYNKTVGLQGVTPTNLIDLQIQGLGQQFNALGSGWNALVNLAQNAINGPGLATSASNNLSVAMDGDDFISLQNYAMLTACKVIFDAS